MKPKTRIQKEVAKLIRRLPELTEKQTAYAFEHCFKHYAHRTKGGILTCTECGHRWKSEHPLAESVCGCTCPHCGKELEVLDTRKRVFKEMEYFSIITTCKQFQVIRFFAVHTERKVCQPAKYSINEVVQRWIAPDGKTETVARLRCQSLFYCDLWNECSSMEIRSNKTFRAYDIDPICTYPTIKVIPEAIRNGYKGNFHNILPYDFFTAILSDSRKETLLKSGQTEMLRHSIVRTMDLQRYWNSIKICIRNGYTIPDGSLWCDTIDFLRHFGKDTNCPKYVCPTDLKAEHDQLLAKRNRQRERERTEAERQKMIENEKNYLKAKGMFFGLVFSDNLIFVKVIDSVEEMETEGRLMHHCVGGYHNKVDSLILSATIDGKRIETIEVSLKTLKVVQSRGVCNSNTEYHDRIIRLVEDNAGLIQQRMNVA